MVLDSSAIVAIVLEEPGHEALIRALDVSMQRDDVILIGAPTPLETNVVLSQRLRTDARPLVSALLQRADVQIIPFNGEHLDAATS